MKKLFLKISQYSQENTCFGADLQLIKKRLQHRCFSVNSAIFLRKPILKNIYERVLLLKVFIINFRKNIQLI